MSVILWAIGLVLIVEGLVLALAPLRIDDLLRMMTELSRDQKRLVGLVAVALGAILVWLARALGG
jgi:uncharacterized protein